MTPKLFLLNSASPLLRLLLFHPSLAPAAGWGEPLWFSSQTSCTAQARGCTLLMGVLVVWAGNPPLMLCSELQSISCMPGTKDSHFLLAGKRRVLCWCSWCALKRRSTWSARFAGHISPQNCDPGPKRKRIEVPWDTYSSLPGRAGTGCSPCSSPCKLPRKGKLVSESLGWRWIVP